jgi:hypothetical protein
MHLMSGFTLGFFFPKQRPEAAVKARAAGPGKDEMVRPSRSAEREERDREFEDLEWREFSAALTLHRLF